MRLTVDGDEVSERVSSDLLERSIRSLDGTGDSFVILSKEEMTYLQTSGDPRNGFVLEYQNGTLEEHYSCIEPNLNAEQVVRAFQQYYSNDSRWKSDLRWEKAGFGESIGGPRPRFVLIAIGAVAAAVLIWRFLYVT